MFFRLRESDSKLTDIRLAALNYQHELEQMKNEIRQLREERDNLKSNANRMSHALTIGSYNSTTTGTLNSNKTSDGDFETDNKIVVFLEIFEAEKKIIGKYEKIPEIFKLLKIIYFCIFSRLILGCLFEKGLFTDD